MAKTKEKRKTTSLQDLRVMRMDGVDSPATGEDFLILKSDDPDELQENMTALVEKNREALRLLTKEEIKQPELVALLNQLVSMTAVEDEDEDNIPAFKECGTKGKKDTKKTDIKASSTKDPDEDEDEDGDDGEAGVTATKTTKDDLPEDAMVEKVASKIMELLGKADKTPLQSRQVDDEPVTKARPKKLGQGLFESVIFGQ